MNRFQSWITGVILLASSVTALAQADQVQYRVTTYAGNTGGGPVDGFGTRARFGRIVGVAADRSGNVYVAETDNVVRKIAPNGLVTTLAGAPGVSGYVDGQGSVARFVGPNDVAVDSHGNVFVADFEVIRKIAPDGTVSTFAGAKGSFGTVDGVGPAAQFMTPWGLAIDSADNLYVADIAASVIRKITPEASVTTFAGIPGQSGAADGPPGTATFMAPGKISVDRDGTVYVAGEDRIRKISATGVVSSILLPYSITTMGLCVGLDGALYVVDGSTYGADYGRTGVFIVGGGGSMTRFSGNRAMGFKDGAPDVARFYVPRIIALASDGSFYVADVGTIRNVSVTGWVQTIAGIVPTTVYNPSAPDAFAGPAGIAIDNSGNLYVTDFTQANYFGVQNSTIRKVAPDGTVTVLAGPGQGYHGNADGVGANASFNGPHGVAVDAAGNVYVADSGNAAIRKITPAGVVTTFAQTPCGGLVMDHAGNLFISEATTYTIRKLSAAGAITIVAGQPGIQGSADGPAAQATFRQPAGIAVDDSGTLYIVDSWDSTVRTIRSDGTVTTLAGTAGVLGYADGVGGAAQFNHPTALAVDRAGNVFVADSGNNVLRRVTPAGVVTTIAGVAGKYMYLDGVASAARLWDPSCVAIDAAGNIFFGDNDCIRVANVVSTIVAQPRPATVQYGTPATLTVSAAPATSYQWYANGAAIAGATNATLQVSNAGFYSVDVYNGVVPTRSDFVPVSAASDLRNVSGRASVQTGDNVAIVGFVLAAPTGVKKQVLLRGAGPALANLGVATPAMNPVLTLFDATGAVIGTGAAWGSAPTAGPSAVGAVIPASSGALQRAGAFAYDATSTDAAFVATLPAGAYTATCSSTSGGVGLTEVYALDLQDSASLTNLSVRGYVSSEPIIEGFVSTGSVPAKFLIRGVGPTLQHLGVSSPLPKPTLTLCDSAGHVIAGNTGWQNAVSRGDSSIAATVTGATNPQMTSVGAFPLDAGSSDCAMIVTLPAGAYSAILTPASGTNGTGLLELYRLNN